MPKQPYGLQQQQHTDSQSIHLAWMIKLRWSMLAGQIILFLGVQWGLQLSLPLRPLVLLTGLGVCSNIGLGILLRRGVVIREWQLGVVMLFDIILLTGLLFVTGGPANPFSFLYLIYIALGIVVLDQQWMWGISIAAMCGYGCLFLQKGGHSHTIHNPLFMRMHLEGMWLAYAVTTVFIGYFVTRMKRALTRREAELTALNDLQMRSEKIAALAALAGGAVHEFSTPLSTIAVIAKELEHRFGTSPQDAEILADVRLIREEVERCKRISHELMNQAGETLGEASLTISIEALFDNVLDGFANKDNIQVHVDQDARLYTVPIPPVAFAQMLRGMLSNAREASTPTAPVQLTARVDTERLLIEVIDQGCGIEPAILSHLGEPFFTTKPASQGHGLGLFLAKTLMERLGGQLRIDSTLGKGTTVALAFPLAPLNPPATTQPTQHPGAPR